MEIRTSAPAVNNKYYVKTTHGGYNKCIVINSETGSVLPNCVGYAYGRFMESANIQSCSLPTSNACDWYNANHGYQKGAIAKQGSIICFSGGWQNKGHVAFVEEVYENGSILISQSNYGGVRWETKTLYPPFTHGNLTLQGFIYNPYIEETESKIKMRGIDVSEWQVPNTIDLAQYDFVMIRATYGKTQDKYANDWRLKCEELNVPYGVYCYSYAESSEEAQREADYIASVIENWSVQMGVWFDEETDNFKREHGLMSANFWTSACDRFCQRMQDYGYYTGIYSSESNFGTLILTDKWDRWVASWGTNDGTIQRDTSHLGTLLQYSSHGGLDRDVAYCDLEHYKSYPVSQMKPNNEEIKENDTQVIPSENTSQNVQYEPINVNDGYLFKMSNKMYDFLNWLVHITPLFITLYIALSNIWKWDYTEPIVATISAIVVFISSIVKQSTIGYKSNGGSE